VRLVGWLAEEEAAVGTPVEALIARLPKGMAEAIRCELRKLLAASDGPA
jgi:hypothetical protein